MFAAGAGLAVDENPARQLQRLHEEVARLSEEKDRLAKAAQGVLARLDALSAEARYYDARIEELSLEEAQMQAFLEETEARRAATQLRLDGSRMRLATTARLLQQAGPLGRLKPVLAAGDAGALAAGLRGTHELAWRFRGEVTTIREAGVRLAEIEAEQRARREELARLRDEAVTARAGLETSIRSRRALLAEMQQETSVRDAAVLELERARADLEGIIAGAAELQPVRLDVRRFKGLLPLPVEGAKVEQGFGDRIDPRFGTRLPHPGWDLAASFGAIVRAPFDARVAWTGWLRGYGLVVVLDHGSGVHSIYGHLSAAIVKVGDPIAQGESLGRVGDTGSTQGAYLYVEVRVNGRPEDPFSWFVRWKLPR